MRLTRWRFVPTPGWPTPPDDPACLVVAPLELSPPEAEQLAAAAGFGSELRFTVADLFGESFAATGPDAEWISTSLETPFEAWDLEHEGETRFQLWLYFADAGLVFEAGTTRAVAQAIQSGSAWELLDPSFGPEFRRALAEAHRRAAAEHPRSMLAGYYPWEAEG